MTLKNIKNTASESIKKLKNIRREDLTKDNIVDLFKNIYTDYIKPFDILKLSYVPFIGWFIPMYLNKDEFQKYHAKQGFVLAVYFTTACIFLYCFKVFVPERADIIQLFVVILIYIHHIVYFTLCYLGTKMINRGEKGEFPYIQQHITKFTVKIEI